MRPDAAAALSTLSSAIAASHAEAFAALRSVDRKREGVLPLPLAADAAAHGQLGGTARGKEGEPPPRRARLRLAERGEPRAAHAAALAAASAAANAAADAAAAADAVEQGRRRRCGRAAARARDGGAHVAGDAGAVTSR